MVVFCAGERSGVRRASDDEASVIDRRAPSRRRLRRLGCTALFVTPLVSCGGSDPLVVFAAASLADALDDVVATVMSPSDDALTISYAGSSTLAAQIVNGAPADVFISANPTQMEAVVAHADGHGPVTAVATNSLVIAVEAGNPHGITGLDDLAARTDEAGAALLVALADTTVPAGQYAQQALAAAGVALTPVTLEADVRAVLTKVALGEVDAGIVYATDITAAAGTVDAVPLGHPDAEAITANYLAVALDGSNERALAFVDALTNADTHIVLSTWGFGAP